MQQVARGMRANPRDLAKPREHIFTRSGGTETVIRDRELGWWTEEWRDFKRPPPPLLVPHEPLSRGGGGDRKQPDIIQCDRKLSGRPYDPNTVGDFVFPQNL